jgi:hypothetical protein
VGGEAGAVVVVISLVWMLAEGAVGVLTGAEGRSIGVIAGAVGSAVEAPAA